MKIDIRKSRSMRTNGCSLLGLLAALATLPALAAPGDHSVAARLPPTAEADQPAGVAFSYLHIAGSTFHPLDNTTTYDYPGNGCIAKTGGTSPLFAHKVVLPEGAFVYFLRLYFYDDSASLVTAFFTSYDGAGNFVEWTSVGSTTTNNYGSTLSPEYNYTVNQATGAINVVANLGSQNDSTLRFCGVRIAYVAPITDRIFTNGFDPNPL